MLLSGCASCPVVSCVSVAFVLGFFATGGGTLIPFFSDSGSLDDFVTEESLPAMVFWMFALASVGCVGSMIILLEKIKLAVLDGDLWRSPPSGDGGECRLRREGGPSFDLAAVLRRMASCRFMEGEMVTAGGDFFVGEKAVDEVEGRTTVTWDFGTAGCEVTMAGGDVDVGEVTIRERLMGF